jgi:hypothetical protein
MWLSRCGGGIHSTNLRKNAFNSNTKQSATMKAHWKNFNGLEVGFHRYESQDAGVNCIIDRLTVRQGREDKHST